MSDSKENNYKEPLEVLHTIICNEVPAVFSAVELQGFMTDPLPVPSIVKALTALTITPEVLRQEEPGISIYTRSGDPSELLYLGAMECTMYTMQVEYENTLAHNTKILKEVAVPDIGRHGELYKRPPVPPLDYCYILTA